MFSHFWSFLVLFLLVIFSNLNVFLEGGLVGDRMRPVAGARPVTGREN